jgi:hypothetical protein
MFRLRHRTAFVALCLLGAVGYFSVGISALCTSALCTIGLPMVPDRYIVVSDWKMDTPITVFGFDKFGLRRGHFILKTLHNNRAVHLVLSPQVLAGSEDQDSTIWADNLLARIYCVCHRVNLCRYFFADCAQEHRLGELATLRGRVPLRVRIDQWGEVREVSVQPGGPMQIKLADVADPPGTFDEHKWVWANGLVDGKFPPQHRYHATPRITLRSQSVLSKAAEGPEIMDEHAWSILESRGVAGLPPSDLYLDPDTSVAVILLILSFCPAFILAYIFKRAVNF